MLDWSQLPKDLLQLISQKLNSDFYILRFRSLCSSWRLSIPKPHNHFPLKLSHYSGHCKLYNHNIFLIKPPQYPTNKLSALGTLYSLHGRSLVTFEGEQKRNIITHDSNSGGMKGRPCLAEDTGRTVMIESNLSVHLLVEIGFGDDVIGDIYIIVENEFELLLFHKYNDYVDDELKRGQKKELKVVGHKFKLT
ncbi:uncharacterized protein LOC131625642 [Vicia villosa]|uniref:uncharacterized protein LOC131625642 n=1 Tax=Vicia villosa TaxID=3911 RepID=UPI00273BD37D|nr:uncharacterized protein LOC131625642 [Vicia villosa]